MPSTILAICITSATALVEFKNQKIVFKTWKINIMEKYCRESWKWETRLENEDSMDNSDDRSGNTDQTESYF